MLFIVPDANEQSAKTPPQGGKPAAGGRPSPAVKVELDLEDAPFLEDPAKEEETPQEEAKPAESKQLPQGTEEEKPLSWKDRLRAKKKTLIAAGVAALLLSGAAVAVNMLFFSQKTPTTPETAPRRVTLQDETPAPGPAAAAYFVEWEPFLIEVRGSQGEILFLHCKFSVPTESPDLYGELAAKRIPLRDAVYYYFRNKPLTFLSDKTKQKDLKDDLISVINEHISSAKISELYFEEYVVTGNEHPAISATPGGPDGPRGKTR